MGTFAGHALPGTFFIVFSIWWTISQFHRYFTCYRRNVHFTSSPTYPLSCGKYKLPLFEPIIKIVLVAIGLFGEIYTGYDRRVEKFTLPGNAQHSTMFFVFGISGVLDILVYYKSPIPVDIDYAIVLLALGVEGLLFKFHLHGRDELNVRLHVLLIYAVVLNIVGVILEMKYRHNFLAALSRTYFFFVQGTWFWQMGLILYNPNPYALKWLPDDHFELMMVTMYFAWHCGIVFLVMLAIGCVVAFFHKRCFHGYSRIQFNLNGTTEFNQNENVGTYDENDSEESEL